MAKQDIVGCHECDFNVTLPQLIPGQKASCPRCGYVITRYIARAQHKLLASASTALIFLILAIPFPFIVFSSQGNQRTITLIQSFENIATLNFDVLAILLILTTFIIPLVFLVCVIYVLVSIQQAQLLPHTKSILKSIFLLNNWNMAEIFLVGILVSFIKIAAMAKVTLGMSFIAYALFVLSLTATASLLDRYQCWRWIKEHE